MSSQLRFLFALMLVSASAPAEFLHVELSVGGLDCASCAQSVDRILKRIRGVETASFRTEGSVAVVDLKPGNTVTLEQIRDAVKGIGYTPGAAKVTARGEARAEGGKWRFRVSGSGAEYPLEVSAGQAIAGAVTVEGAIPAPGAPMIVSAMRRE